MKLVLATRNPHKLREFARLLEPRGVTVEPLPDDVQLPDETGATFAENAILKARFAASATGRPAIGDDSGIEAAALNGAPGVHSARFAGKGATDEDNLAKLLSQAPAGSAVRYVCVLAHVDPGTGAETLFEGLCRGTLTDRPRGSDGFGYDPAFLPDSDTSGRTMAELDATEKDAISHRGEAARGLLRWLDA